MTFNKTSDTTFDLHLDFKDKKSLLCKEAFLFGNTEVRHLDVFIRAGKHMLAFNMPTADEKADVAFGGIKTYMFCEGIKDELESVLRTVSLFLGGMSLNPDPSKYFNSSFVPEYMAEANVRFLSNSMGYTMEKRKARRVDIDESTIHSGDFFPVIRLDGLAPIIMYGSGAWASHCTMALWFDDELYIVESTDGWYWPTGGLQRTPYKTWV